MAITYTRTPVGETNVIMLEGDTPYIPFSETFVFQLQVDDPSDASLPSGNTVFAIGAVNGYSGMSQISHCAGFGLPLYYERDFTPATHEFYILGFDDSFECDAHNPLAFDIGDAIDYVEIQVQPANISTTTLEVNVPDYTQFTVLFVFLLVFFGFLLYFKK